MNNKSKNKNTGKKGEEIACSYLEKIGYKIIETNFRYSKIAEIDIIAKYKNTIVFVEVKTRTTQKCGHPFESITQQKLKNIQQAALFFLQTTKEKYQNFQIDIISIIRPENPIIEHLKNISLN